MSDNQRRSICRILFVIVCVLPTFAIGYWICHPQTASGWERAIRAQLGVTARIDSIETPGPYVTILRGLEFLDPDGETLFKTVVTRIEYGRDLNKVIIPHKVHHLTNEGLAFLIKRVNQNVVRNRSLSRHWTVVCLEDATIEESTHAITPRLDSSEPTDEWIPPLTLANSLKVSGLQIDIGPTVPQADGTFAHATFRIGSASVGDDPDQLVSCEMSKTDQFGHALVLDTNGTGLPCWLLGDLALDLPATLGSNATFRGDLLIKSTATNSSVEIAGTFEGVDLSRSIAGNMQTNAMIRLNNCEYFNGEFKVWDAILKPDADSPPTRIDEKYLFKHSSNFDIASALFNTLSGTPRSANR